MFRMGDKSPAAGRLFMFYLFVCNSVKMPGKWREKMSNVIMIQEFILVAYIFGVDFVSDR